MAKTVLLHIGLPKTGTTSIQRLLQANVPKLQAQGFDVYRANLLSEKNLNSRELHLSCLRSGTRTFATDVWPDIDREQLYERTREAVREFVSESPADYLIFSSEELALLRTHEECLRLRSLFPGDVSFRVFLVLREPKEWLRSYIQEIRRRPGREPLSDPDSAFCVEPGSWVRDFAGLQSRYRTAIGPVAVIDYDKNRANSNPLSAFGVQPWPEVDELRSNLSPWNEPFLKRFRRRVALRSRLRRGLARFGLK